MYKWLKYLFVVILLILGILYMCIYPNQKIDEKQVSPSSFSAVKVYAVDGFKAEAIDRATLDKSPSMYFDKKLVHDVFMDVNYHSRNKVIWQGCLLGIAELKSGEEKKLRISVNGAYYDIVGQAGYYQTTQKSREIFRRLLNQELNELPSK